MWFGLSLTFDNALTWTYDIFRTRQITIDYGVHASSSIHIKAVSRHLRQRSDVSPLGWTSRGNGESGSALPWSSLFLLLLTRKAVHLCWNQSWESPALLFLGSLQSEEGTNKQKKIWWLVYSNSIPFKWISWTLKSRRGYTKSTKKFQWKNQDIYIHIWKE